MSHSEERLEQVFEAKTGALDRRFMSTAMTQAEYDVECAALGRWFDAECVRLQRPASA